MRSGSSEATDNVKIWAERLSNERRNNMKTVKLDILNDDAMKLLKNLEALKLVRFRKERDTIESPRRHLSLSDFSFSESRTILKDYEGSLSDATVDDRRSEI